MQITTGSGVATAAHLVIDKIDVLDRARVGFPVLCHTLPPSAPIDGLLGLDFFRDLALTIDFRMGFIILT
jgi:hypothetical protein